MQTVVIYTRPGCRACRQVKAYLARRGVRFTERNVADDPAAMQELLARGSLMTPTIVIDDEHVVIGFDPARLDALLERE